MSRYLFAMWDGGGAVAPELGVARRLAARGHEVHVIADPTLRGQVLGVGASFAPWETAPHRVSSDPAEDIVKDWEVTSPFEGLRRMRDRLIGGPASRVAADTAAQIAAFAPDAMVVDYFLFGAVIAAQAAGLPVAALVPNIWALPVRGVPPVAGGFPLAKGPLGRARDSALVAIVNRVFAKGLPSLNGTRAAYGLSPLPSFYDQVLSSDRILVLTSPTFDYAAPFVPANVRYVGPILDEPVWAEPWTQAVTHTQQPLVLVGLSSTFQNQAPLLQRTIDALATLPVQAVVTTGPAIDPAELTASGDVRVVRSAPHGQLIDHAAAVVTHCGHGTTLKSLAAGVPMVCIPMGRDQDDTAARVVHHGAGVRLSRTASVNAIRSAVARVLGRAEYRAAATKLATAIRHEDASSTLVSELEGVARRRTIHSGEERA
jgi:MGT family glycosyltransferase